MTAATIPTCVQQDESQHPETAFGAKTNEQRTSAPASGPVVSWRRVFFVGGSNLEKYVLTASSVSASVISLMSLSHEKGLERAWLARPTAENSVKKRMVATVGGGARDSEPSFIYDMLTQHQRHMKVM